MALYSISTSNRKNSHSIKTKGCLLIYPTAPTVSTTESSELPRIIKQHALKVGRDFAQITWSYEPSSDSKYNYEIQIIYKVHSLLERRVEFKELAKKGETEVTLTKLRSGTPYEIYLHTKFEDKETKLEGKWTTALIIQTSKYIRWI